MSAPVITFMSDYGLSDGFVGVCHGVIARLCPDARVIDITHGVARHDVRAGAIILRSALPFMPSGVHLAVVDPDVGAARRAVAMRVADDSLLVGPDNGLLSLAAAALGGVVEAVDIAQSPFRLEPVSATFHGRDIFAPVAARLAGGAALASAGAPCDPDELVVVELPAVLRVDGAIVAHALNVDRFGNVHLNVGRDELAGPGLRLGGAVGLSCGSDEDVLAAQFVRTFADVHPGELLLYEDANRMFAVAVGHGSATERLGLAAGDKLWIRPT